jgi:cold shock CspA family protein
LGADLARRDEFGSGPRSRRGQDRERRRPSRLHRHRERPRCGRHPDLHPRRYRPRRSRHQPHHRAFTWTPSETQHGPHTFDVVVTDNGTPTKSDSETITITVTETNTTPTLNPVGNQAVNEGAPLAFTATATDPDLPANILSFSLTGAPAGAAINPLTGAFTWTPNEAQDGAHTFDIVVTDDGTPALTDSETITVSVGETNRAPTLDPVGNRSGAEGSPLVFTATASDPDDPANLLSFSLTGAPAGAAIDPVTGVFTWTPNETQHGPHTFDIVVTDNGTPTKSDSETNTITVTETNTAPAMAHPGNQTNGEGDAVTLSLSVTDPDVPTNTLAFSAVRLPTGLAIDPATGIISGTIDPIAALGSPYAVVITVVDDGTPVLQDQASFIWTVTDTNRSPILDPVGDTSVAEEALLSFTATASDPDGDGFTFSLADGATGSVPAGAAISPTGDFTWTPTEAQDGSHTFDIVVTDDGIPALNDAETIIVTVTEGPNRAPMLDPIGNKSVAEGTPLSFTVAATDPDIPADLLTYALAGAPTGAAIDPASGAFTWTPTEAQDGSHTFDIVVTDNGTPNLADSKTITVTVKEMNSAPSLIHPGNQTSAEGDTVTMSLNASDPDLPANTLSYSATRLPAGLVIDPTTGVVSGTIDPIASLGSPYAVTVTVIDDASPALGDEVSFIWHVTHTNHPPVLDTIADATVTEGAQLSFTARASDPDPDDTLTFGLADGAGSVPAGAATFKIVVTDDGTPALSDRTPITITVLEQNQPPIIAHPGNQASYEGTTVNITIVASDPDIPSQPVALAASGLPPGLGFDPSTGSITGTIADGSAADSPYTVSVTASDGSSEAGLTFRWSVTVPNRPPTGADAALTTFEDGPLNARLTAVDPDGDSVSIIVRDRPSLGTLTVDGTRIHYVPSLGVSGTDTFTYVVSDGKAASETYTVTIVIEALNAAGEPLRIAAPGLLLNDTDPDGDPLIVRLVAAPNTGDLTLAGDGSLTYRPADGFVGTDQFTYAVADPSGERAVATSLITVAPAPAVPATSSATRAMVVDEIMAAGPDLDEAAEPEPLVGRSLVLMNRAARAGVQQMGFPLVLLLAALVGVLSVGRVSAVPWLRRGERQTGIVHTYDDDAGYGLVVRDEDSAEVFVHRVAIPRRLRAILSVGDAVDFYAITGPHRDVVRKLRLRR